MHQVRVIFHFIFNAYKFDALVVFYRVLNFEKFQHENLTFRYIFLNLFNKMYKDTIQKFITYRVHMTRI